MAPTSPRRSTSLSKTTGTEADTAPRKAPRVRVKAPGGAKAEVSDSKKEEEAKPQIAVQHDDGQEQISLPS